MHRTVLKSPMFRQVATAAVAVVALTSQALCRAGGPIVDTGGFESFSMLPLAGQNGWASSGTGTATVQASVGTSGSQGVKVDKSAGSDSRWGDLVSGYPTERFIMIDWDMRVLGTGASAGAFGPIFGVEAYDGHLPLPAAARVLGSAFVDATTGDVLVQAVGGNLVETGTIVPFNTWQSFRLLIDFTLDNYTVFLNGTKLQTIGFVDPGTEFTDADISALAAFSDDASKNRLGTAYFDNFIVRDGIPGDFDADGDADGADFADWKVGFGTTAGNIADSDGDQDSDGADFLTWQRQRGVNLLAATPVSAAAPEPTAVVLAVFAALGARSVRRSKSSGHQLTV